MSDVADATGEFTIDELARRTGMTVRNIRAHQSRGLLPPPEVRGRTGYYGPKHVQRIELIREMQSQGFNLEAIRRIVEAAPNAGDEPLRFLQALHRPYVEEEPEVLTGDQLAERWHTKDPKLLARAIELGFLRPLEDGTYEDRSPRLGRVADELADLGVPMDIQLELAASVREHADGIAQAYVQLFLEHVWQPFQEAGAPDERWPEVLEALERLRPLAAESVLAVFALAMRDATEEAFGRERERIKQHRDPAAR